MGTVNLGETNSEERIRGWPPGAPASGQLLLLSTRYLRVATEEEHKTVCK